MPDVIHLSPQSHGTKTHKYIVPAVYTPYDDTLPPLPKLAQKSSKGVMIIPFHHISPESRLSYKPPLQRNDTEATNVAPRQPVVVNISISNQAPVTHSPSTLPLESAGDADNYRVK